VTEKGGRDRAFRPKPNRKALFVKRCRMFVISAFGIPDVGIGIW